MAIDCTTQGDGDLYGLGVRLGLYLQWAAGFLLRNGNGSWRTISAVRMANNALCLAIVVTVIINSARGSSLSTDYLIVYYITIALFYAESYNLLIKKSGEQYAEGYHYSLRPDVPLLIQNFLFALATTFGAWFWLRGFHHGAQPVCTAKAAMLGVFDLENKHWRIFAMVFAIIGGIIFGIFFVVHFIGFYTKGVNAPVTTLTRVMHSSFGNTRTQFLKPLFKPSPESLWKSSSICQLINSAIHYFLINLAGPLIAIVSVERMVSANHLVTASILESSGQMIAIVTGASSLCAAIWELSRSALAQRSAPSRPSLVMSYIYNSQQPPGEEELKLAIEELTRLLSNFKGEKAEGQKVAIKDGLVVIEALPRENTIPAPLATP